MLALRVFERDEIGEALPRHTRKESLVQVTMGIDDANAASFADVLKRHRLDQRRLPDAGATDEEQVEEAIGVLNAEAPIRPRSQYSSLSASCSSPQVHALHAYGSRCHRSNFSCGTGRETGAR